MTSWRRLAGELGLELLRLRRRAGFWWLLAAIQFMMLVVAVAAGYEIWNFYLTQADALVPLYYFPLEWTRAGSLYGRIAVALLTVLIFGPDYGSGTYRTLYSRGAGRLRVPLVKTLLVSALGGANWLLWTGMAWGMGIYFQQQTGLYGRVLVAADADLAGGGDFALAVLRSLVALLVYCLFAATAVSLFRGTVLGFAGVLGMLFLEMVAVPVGARALTAWYGFDLSLYYEWSVTRTLDRFAAWPAAGGIGAVAGTLGGVTGYALFFCLALWLCYVRRDVPGRP